MTPMTTPLKPYWVTYAGVLVDDEGQFDHKDVGLNSFLSSLTKELIKHPYPYGPGVLTYGDGRVILTAVVQAMSQGGAVDLARGAFTDAICAAGGFSDLPDGRDNAWAVARLLGRATVEELTAPAAPSRVA